MCFLINNSYFFQRTELLIPLGYFWSNLFEFLIRIEEQHLSSHPSLSELHLDQVYIIPHPIHPCRSYTCIRYTHPSSHPSLSELHLDQVYSSLIPSIIVGVTLVSGILIPHPIHHSRSYTWIRYTHPSSHLSLS